MIYFDNAATYINDNKDVIDVFIRATNEYPANTSSTHRLGYYANKKLDELRADVIHLLKLNKDYEVIFNSGATEGINHAIKGYALRNRSRGNEIICFKNEHPAVLNSVAYLSKIGFKIIYINPDKSGSIIVDEIKNQINNNTIMVIAMSVNNEIGSINDLNQIYNIVKKYPKCVLFSDVTQSIGKINFNYNNLDMFAFSIHKIGGIIGSGILVKKKKILLDKLIDGGPQENNYRPGTVSLPLIISSVYALKKAINNLLENYKHVYELNLHLHAHLKRIDEVFINSNSDFPYIVNFSLKSKRASVVIEALSSKEIYVSSLSACNSKHNVVSTNLLNMGVDKRLAENSIRVSFSNKNTLNEVDTFIKILKEILERIR